MFHFRKAITLAIRNFCVTLAGTAAGIPLAHNLADFKMIGYDWLFAAYAATASFILTFLLNIVEDNTRLNLGTKSFTVPSATRQG